MNWTRTQVFEKLESLGKEATRSQMIEKLTNDALVDKIDASIIFDDIMSYKIYADTTS